MIRELHGLDVDHNGLWMAREIMGLDSRVYWIGTSHQDHGLAEFQDMKGVIWHYLSYLPETWIIRAGWGKESVISNLVPKVLADLAIRELNGLP